MTREGRQTIPRHRCRGPLDQGQLPTTKTRLELKCVNREIILLISTPMLLNYTVFSDRLEYSLEDIIVDNYVQQT
jgi:hypothetical protein